MSILKEEAEDFIQRYIRLHNDLLELPDVQDIADPVLRDYYSSGLISFIFTKDRIDALFEDTTANALRIYYGAHSDGHPTLVIAGTYVSPEHNTADNKVVDPGIDGGVRADQHPDPATSESHGLVFDLANDPIS